MIGKPSEIKKRNFAGICAIENALSIGDWGTTEIGEDYRKKWLNLSFCYARSLCSRNLSDYSDKYYWKISERIDFYSFHYIKENDMWVVPWLYWSFCNMCILIISQIYRWSILHNFCSPGEYIWTMLNIKMHSVDSRVDVCHRRTWYVYFLELWSY